MKFLCIISGCPEGAWKWHILQPFFRFQKKAEKGLDF